MQYLEYQEKAYSTCTPECYTDEYLNLGYISEVGELAGKLAKRVRGDVVYDEDIMQEIGDVAWMIAVKNRRNGTSSFRLMENKKHSFISNYEGIMRLVDITVFYRFELLRDFCEYLGFDFDECLKMNIEKLASRKERGKIHGCGDTR